MKNLYLLIDFFSVIFPLLFSFHPKIKFQKEWKCIFPSILITALFFIIWDIYFTKNGVWGFNPKYLTGIYFSNLPIEEILFFICIPYSCLFMYHCIKLIKNNQFSKKTSKIISYSLITILSLLAIFNHQKAYTFTTFILLSSLLLYIELKAKTDYMRRFYFSYIFILIPFFIVNGILTGSGIEEEVVWYNNSENLGIRMLTIPIEDTFYGMLMILMSVVIYNKIRKSTSSIYP